MTGDAGEPLVADKGSPGPKKLEVRRSLCLFRPSKIDGGKKPAQLADIGFTELRHPCCHVWPDGPLAGQDPAQPIRPQLCPHPIQVRRDTSLISHVDFHGRLEVIIPPVAWPSDSAALMAAIAIVSR